MIDTSEWDALEREAAQLRADNARLRGDWMSLNEAFTKYRYAVGEEPLRTCTRLTEDKHILRVALHAVELECMKSSPDANEIARHARNALEATSE